MRRITISLTEDDYRFLLRRAGERWGVPVEEAGEMLKRGERPGVAVVVRELIRRERERPVVVDETGRVDEERTGVVRLVEDPRPERLSAAEWNARTQRGRSRRKR